MIKKIVGASLLFFALIALMLALAGVKEANLSNPFIAFLRNTSQELKQFKIAIPDIPKIDIIEDFTYSTGNWWDTILNAFHTFAVGFAKVINAIITILNFLVLILNTIIELLEFIFLVLKNLITMKNDIINDSGTILVQ